jgi:hypothetical protein
MFDDFNFFAKLVEQFASNPTATSFYGLTGWLFLFTLKFCYSQLFPKPSDQAQKIINFIRKVPQEQICPMSIRSEKVEIYLVGEKKILMSGHDVTECLSSGDRRAIFAVAYKLTDKKFAEDLKNAKKAQLAHKLDKTIAFCRLVENL